MRAIQKSVLAVVMSILCTAAIDVVLGNVAAAADPAFKVTDKNADGKIDRGEFHHRQVEIFYMLDKNKDGFLVVEEAVKIDAETFAAADTNKDGKLSLEEFVNLRFQAFEAADTNNDGVVTREEYTAFEVTGR